MKLELGNCTSHFAEPETLRLDDFEEGVANTIGRLELVASDRFSFVDLVRPLERMVASVNDFLDVFVSEAAEMELDVFSEA